MNIFRRLIFVLGVIFLCFSPDLSAEQADGAKEIKEEDGIKLIKVERKTTFYTLCGFSFLPKQYYFAVGDRLNSIVPIIKAGIKNILFCFRSYDIENRKQPDSFCFNTLGFNRYVTMNSPLNSVIYRFNTRNLLFFCPQDSSIEQVVALDKVRQLIVSYEPYERMLTPREQAVIINELLEKCARHTLEELYLSGPIGRINVEKVKTLQLKKLRCSSRMIDLKDLYKFDTLYSVCVDNIGNPQQVELRLIKAMNITIVDNKDIILDGLENIPLKTLSLMRSNGVIDLNPLIHSSVSELNLFMPFLSRKNIAAILQMKKLYRLNVIVLSQKNAEYIKNKLNVRFKKIKLVPMLPNERKEYLFFLLQCHASGD